MISFTWMLQAERQPLELGVSTRCAPEELSFPTSLCPPLAGGHVPAQWHTVAGKEKTARRGRGDPTGSRLCPSLPVSRLRCVSVCYLGRIRGLDWVMTQIHLWSDMLRLLRSGAYHGCYPHLQPSGGASSGPAWGALRRNSPADSP